ncbi:MAG: Gldg family protein [Acidobacteria bacterium]|nr:Gldg family protein [Acidobacteriota bacterium]
MVDGVVSTVRASLKTRRARYGGAAGLTVSLVVGILILTNFLNFRYHERLDLTENQVYSLSEQSRKVVENLTSDIQIIGFFRGEPGRAGFEDLVKQYRTVSSRVGYEIVDPDEEPGKTAQYEIQRNAQVVVLGGAKREIMDNVDEQKLTSAIIKITREEEKVVYFLEGHGERDTSDTEAEGLTVARQEIEKQNYRVETYNLAQEGQLPEDATVIVSVGPQVPFFPTEADLLRSFLDSGGKLLLLVDPQTEFQMEDFLGEYGLGLGDKVVIDASGIGQIFGLGAAAPLVAEYADHPITRELSGVMTFFPMAQNVTTSSSGTDYRTIELLLTTPNSWAESHLEDGEASFDEGQDVEGPVTLAAVATRSVPEQSEGNPIPEVEAGEGEEEASLAESDLATSATGESRFVLFGDADFASNAYFNSVANGDLFLMTIGWLAEEADLVAIRTREMEDRRINMTFSQSRWVFLVTVVLFPLTTLILGTTVWHRRRATRH